MNNDNNMENQNSPSSALASEDILVFKSGKTNLTLPKDNAHIDILISVLQTMKNKEK